MFLSVHASLVPQLKKNEVRCTWLRRFLLIIPGESFMFTFTRLAPNIEDRSWSIENNLYCFPDEDGSKQLVEPRVQIGQHNGVVYRQAGLHKSIAARKKLRKSGQEKNILADVHQWRRHP